MLLYNKEIIKCISSTRGVPYIVYGAAFVRD